MVVGPGTSGVGSAFAIDSTASGAGGGVVSARGAPGGSSEADDTAGGASGAGGVVVAARGAPGGGAEADTAGGGIRKSTFWPHESRKTHVSKYLLFGTPFGTRARDNRNKDLIFGTKEPPLLSALGVLKCRLPPESNWVVKAGFRERKGLSSAQTHNKYEARTRNSERKSR
jgi:hypothetical protein